MGRLTSHFDYCDYTECRHYDKELAKKDNCNFIHSSRNQCLEYAVYNKLREYEDLEEQVLKSTGTDLASMVGEFMHYYNLKKENRLLELPCKVGDKVYSVEYRNDAEIVEEEVVSFEVTRKWIYVYGIYDKFIGRLGGSVFATKEEAEKALAETEKENE